MTAGFLIYFFVVLFLHVVKCDNKGNILWSTCAECLWKQFFCSLRYCATAVSFNEPPHPRVAATRAGAKSCARCFVFSTLVSAGALFLASGCESGVPEEAVARHERGEQELRPLREAAERQGGDAVLTVPCKRVWHLLTVPLASGGPSQLQREKMLTSCGLLALGGVSGNNSFWCLLPDSFVNSWVLIWYKCSWNILVGQTAILI